MAIASSNRQHAVDRRLEAAGDLGGHHLGEASVVAEDRIGRGLARHLDDVAELDIGALADRAAGGQRRRQDALVEGERAAGQRDGDVDRLEAVAALRIADLHPADQRADRVVDRLLLDAVEFERLLVDREAQALGRLAETVVDVDDEIDRLERLAHFRGERAAARRVRAIDFGEQRREHRRPGRNLDHLERRAGGQREIGEPTADVERDRVARALALVFGDEIDREVALLRIRAQVVVAHEAVEVERRRRARVGLDRRQLGQVLEPLGRGHQRPIGFFQARAVRQVEDHLDFRLVVERQAA